MRSALNEGRSPSLLSERGISPNRIEWGRDGPRFFEGSESTKGTSQTSTLCSQGILFDTSFIAIAIFFCIASP